MKFKTEQVAIKVGSEKMAGVLFIPQLSSTPLPSIVIFHGRGSTKKRYFDRAQALTENGFLTLVFDFRGCGESDGKFSDQTIAMGFADALAGFDFLAKHYLADKKRIGVLGTSFGGYQAALLSEKRPIASLILAVPAVFQDLWMSRIPETIYSDVKDLFWKQKSFEKTRAIKAINKYKGSILIIEHEHDEIIPQRVTRSYYDSAIHASLREKQIIPGAPHALYDQKFLTKSASLVTAWFLKTL